jgi:hypothetical protein
VFDADGFDMNTSGVEIVRPLEIVLSRDLWLWQAAAVYCVVVFVIGGDAGAVMLEPIARPLVDGIGIGAWLAFGLASVVVFGGVAFTTVLANLVVRRWLFRRAGSIRPGVVRTSMRRGELARLRDRRSQRMLDSGGEEECALSLVGLLPPVGGLAIAPLEWFLATIVIALGIVLPTAAAMSLAVLVGIVQVLWAVAFAAHSLSPAGVHWRGFVRDDVVFDWPETELLIVHGPMEAYRVTCRAKGKPTRTCLMSADSVAYALDRIAAARDGGRTGA